MKNILIVAFFILAGYYSSRSARYLVYDNPTQDTRSRDGTVSSNQQIEALKTALAIGRILGRIVILPRFHCPGACPLNSLIAITAFDSQFKEQYRESSFLTHPKVPVEVRENVSSCYSLTSVVKTTNISTPVAVSSSEIRQKLSSVSSRVLSLGCLYDVHVTLDSSDEQQAFDNTVKKAIKRSDYRQRNMMHK